MIDQLQFPPAYRTTNSEILLRELNTGARGLREWADSVSRDALSRLLPTRLLSGRQTLRIGETMQIDTSLGDILIQLPPAAPSNAGRLAAIRRVKGDYPYTVMGATARINDHTHEVFDGTAVLVSDGAFGWWSLSDTGPLRWEDVQGVWRQGTGASALTYEAARDTPFHLPYLRHDQADQVYQIIQMPHSWSRTDVYPHLHFIPEASGTGTFALTGRYAWCQIGGELPEWASWVPYTATYDVATADAFLHRILPLASVSAPAAPVASDMLLIGFARDTSNDTFTASKPSGTAEANIGVLYLDAHFLHGKSGTWEQY